MSSPHALQYGALRTIRGWAEIFSLVWGIPANFNVFGVLAVLLYDTLVMGVSDTLRR